MKKKPNNTIIFLFTLMLIFYALCIHYVIKYKGTEQNLMAAKNEARMAANTAVEQVDIIDALKEDIAASKATITDLKSDEHEFVYLGDFKLTHYCTELENHICGTGDGITSTGAPITAGRSIAVDQTIIPYGSQLYIEGYGYRIAEDCGETIQGRHIDIAVDSHEQALNMGTTTGGVWILRKKP